MEREIAAALESVFPRVGLKSFIPMTGDEKRRQLSDLSNVIMGIRLFNRDLGKGGSGIDDDALLAEEEVVALSNRLVVFCCWWMNA